VRSSNVANFDPDMSQNMSQIAFFPGKASGRKPKLKGSPKRHIFAHISIPKTAIFIGKIVL
jgi:hypothetical protein